MPDHPYYFFFRNESGQRGHLAILSIPSNFSSAAWGELQKGLEAIAEQDPEKRRLGYLYSLSLYPDQRRGPVHWDSELAGANGARYLLMPLLEASAEDIKVCEAHVRRSFDAVSLRVLRPTDSMQQPAEELLGRILAKGQWSDRPADNGLTHRRYFFHHEHLFNEGESGLTAVLSVPVDFSTESWSELQRGLLAIAEPDATRRKLSHLHTLKLAPENVHDGVHWHSELAGSAGESFVLMPMRGATDQQIEACEKHIRTSFDVTALRILRPAAWRQAEAVNLLSCLLSKRNKREPAANDAALPSERKTPSGPVL